MGKVRTASTPAGGSKAEQRIKPGTTVLVIVALVLVAAMVGLWNLPKEGLFVVAPLQILLGSAIFIALIALVVLVFARLGLYDRSAPLALPEGSVRALIALILLIIFIIFANVVFGILSGVPGSQQVAFSGLTSQEVQNLPGQVETRTALPAVTGQPAQFSGTYRIRTTNPDASSLGQQVVTGLLTLVAAISAFYFGSGSVKAGAEAVRRARPARVGPSTLLVLRPNQPARLERTDKGEFRPLSVELGGTALDDGGITASADANDPGPSFEWSDDAHVAYAPGKDAVDPVTLHFVSSADPAVSVDLVVAVPPTGVATPVVPAGAGGQGGAPAGGQGGAPAGGQGGGQGGGAPDPNAPQNPAPQDPAPQDPAPPPVVEG